MRSGKEETGPVRSPGVMSRPVLGVRYRQSVFRIYVPASPSVRRVSRIGARAPVRHALVAVAMAVAALCGGNRAHAQQETSSPRSFIPSASEQPTPFSSLSPQSVIHTSSPADTVHFCLPVDLEERRPISAAKRQGNLNVGEPRTVQMIYFLPNDRSFRADVVQKMKDEIRNAQTFYAEQMRAHGYGNETFRFETDAQGEPLVHRVDGKRSDSYYIDDTYLRVYNEIDRTFDLYANVYIIVIDNSTDRIRWNGRSWGGVGLRRGKNGGFALATRGFDSDLLVHELGHAFGLRHDFNDGEYVMSYGRARDRLSACNAGFLAVHSHLNANIALEEELPPSIELVSPATYPTGSESVPVQLELSDPGGLHQAILFARTIKPHSAAGFLEVKACRGLAGAQDDVVEFDYDGIIPSDGFTSLSDPPLHSMYAEVADMDGNVGKASIVLAENSPLYVATFEEHMEEVWSVSFSPNGAILASGSSDGTVKLWDVAAQAHIATLDGHTGWGSSVSFSPDGTTLVSAGGSLDNSIKLWNLATQSNITTLSENGSFVWTASFSPDGTMLASGSSNGRVGLWDVEQQKHIAILWGHTEPVWSVAFSPEGNMLVSGSSDGTVRLWDVERRQQLVSLDGDTGAVLSVSFSPDGTTFAYGAADGIIRIGGVATGRTLSALEGHTSFVNSVSFSPDGTILASGSSDGTIRLWDIATEENIVTFVGHTATIQSVSFSSNGAALASGARDHTVKLWDVFEWASVVPDPPVNAKATASSAQVSLSWEAPADDGGSKINRYAYRQKENGGAFSEWVDIPDSRPGEANAGSYTVTGLTNGSTYTFELRAVNINGGGRSASVIVTLPLGPTSTESDELPTEVALLGNYPNPFNPETTIGYALPHGGKVRLVVYDLLGHEVAVLVDGSQPAGRYAVRFRGDHLPSGPYAYRLQAGDDVVVRTMILVK